MFEHPDNHKKLTARSRITLYGLLIIFLAGVGGLVWRSQNRITPLTGLETFKKVDDHPLYVMHYQGDYGFDAFLKSGLRAGTGAYSGLTGKSDWSCSCYAALGTTGTPFFGRNFDWSNDPALVLFTNAPNAYASVSMVDAYYLGFGREEPTPEQLQRLVEAPFYPFDGMNEYGLTIGMMAVSSASGGNDPQKITIGSLHVIRLVLDHARNVDEALELLQNYNVDFSAGPPVHYLIADPAGKSVVVEYINNRRVITPNDRPWQVATNFILSGVPLDIAKSSCNRYQKAYDTLSQTGGAITRVGAMDLLQEISQSNTLWSVVYDMTSGELQVVMGQKYDQPHQFNLEMSSSN